MAYRKQSTGLALSLLLTIVSSAQENTPSTNPTAVQPVPITPHVPPPPTLVPGRMMPIPSGNVPQRVLTLIPSPGVTTLARREQVAERQSVPSKVELCDGTTLTGDFYSDGPLHVAALFGPIALPLDKIRGIDWQNKSDQPDDKERQATIVLVNHDSLIVSLTMPIVHLKTTWGHAAIELTKIQSMVLGSEKYKWEDTPLGRKLVPVGADGDAR